MQLFITPQYTLTNNTIIIHDLRILHQCAHVLRYKIGSKLTLQDNNTRYILSITSINKKEIQTIIVTTTVLPCITSVSPSTTIVIALPNRREKAELIVQKCTEIGVREIIFWKANRSTLHEISEKKLIRMQTIALEAAEQSRRRDLPTISYLDNLIQNPILTTSPFILFHQDGHQISTLGSKNQELRTAIIGPEGGFSPDEIHHLTSLPTCMMANLGSTILRMETAAIIGSRLIHNINHEA